MKQANKNAKPKNKRNKAYPNLINLKDRPASERKRIAKKASKIAAKSRTAIKTIKEYVLALLAQKNNEITVKNGLARKIIQLALGGDMRAIELALKVIGEMPAEKQETTIKGAMTINDLSKIPMNKLLKMAREAKIEIKDNER